MADLQEIISRARFAFSGAPKKYDVFKLINGKNTSKEISRKTGRSLSSVIQDMEVMKDLDLVQEKKDIGGKTIKKKLAVVYEKAPLIKHVPLSYFDDVADTRILVKTKSKKKNKTFNSSSVRIPSEKEILDICGNCEDQLYEFKAPGIETDKITKEIAGFLHTKGGGIIFYGVDDDGTIIGSDIRRQDFDQKIQNSIRHTISPQPNVMVKDRDVMGSKVLLVIIPSWNKKTIYQYTQDGRYYIRKGTNIFALKPEEIKELSKGRYVV